MTVSTIAGDFNAIRYKQFKKRYERAVANNEPEFELENQEWLTSFVKYLLEYLKPNFEDGIKTSSAVPG